jgi:hypothetical protein
MDEETNAFGSKYLVQIHLYGLLIARCLRNSVVRCGSVDEDMASFLCDIMNTAFLFSFFYDLELYFSVLLHSFRDLVQLDWRVAGAFLLNTFGDRGKVSGAYSAYSSYTFF